MNLKNPEYKVSHGLVKSYHSALEKYRSYIVTEINLDFGINILLQKSLQQSLQRKVRKNEQIFRHYLM